MRLNSRSGSFVDDVLRVTEGQGVSVVLNSLAGEAMERSIGLLQPFGRFIELGKRDYLANTPIGLRPFRRNLSYFGVDLDQLLASRPDVSQRLFAEVLSLFASGDFTPLPYSVFAADEVVEAMRLMQQAGHVGKILIRPPRASNRCRSERPAAPFPGRSGSHPPDNRRPRRLWSRCGRVVGRARRPSSGARRPLRSFERRCS